MVPLVEAEEGDSDTPSPMMWPQIRFPWYPGVHLKAAMLAQGMGTVGGDAGRMLDTLSQVSGETHCSNIGTDAACEVRLVRA